MEILRYASFTTDSTGGNPAGVVLDARGMDDAAMLAVAANVGFSETAFIMTQPGGSLKVRYFSPAVEVPFCGHATIATAVAWAQRHGLGELQFHTKAGPVSVTTQNGENGSIVATLVSVPPRSAPIAPADLTALLEALRWRPEELDPALPPRAAYAGAWHPIIAAADRARLARLDYDQAALLEIMGHHDWVTIDLVWRQSPTVYHARNPFPPGGVIEDPATGAAAAAFGGYLREMDLVPLPARIDIHQGQDMGRPSLIAVTIPAEPGSGIAVTGTAVRL
jgi:PhzF family phenazine biosynthesis protein